MRMNTYSKVVPGIGSSDPPYPDHYSPITIHQSTQSSQIRQFNPPEKTAQLPPSADFPLSGKKVLLARDL
jgi:hypothetical protein